MSIALALTLITALPDAADLLRTADVRPNIGLLLDGSCSMAQGAINTDCTWFAANYNWGNRRLNKNKMMRAVLVGCRTPADGILDKWHARVSFSIYKFGHANDRAELATAFDSSHAALEAGAQSIPAGGNTPMSLAIRNHAEYLQNHFDDSNTRVCRPNFLLLLSDGDPNGGGANYNLNCPLPGDPRTSLNVPSWAPWLGAEYLMSHKDFLCNVTGEQQIRTYTIGFGAPGSFSPSNLQRIASLGDGEYYSASNVEELDTAFQAIISAMTTRSGIFYSPPTVQHDGLFSENILYTASFRPNDQGPWAGTIKKYCIEPERQSDGTYDRSDRRCMLRASDDGRSLYTNPAAEDLWTGSTTTSASVGGAGAALLARLGTPGGAPRAPLYPRQLVTWRPGTSRYVSVRGSDWSFDDSWTTPEVHLKLLNLLHGYTFDTNPDGTPRAVAEWPLGDPMSSPSALLRYGESCEVPGSCFVVIGMNDGMLHFFDAADGRETTALIPAELWRPNAIGNELLGRISNQPSADATHRYYVDGGLVLFHADTNGDGRIQETDEARLVFGLGRGGSAYYQIPVTRFNGTLSQTDNPVRPLTYSAGTAFQELRETWATPWAGQMKISSVLRNVAVFPSGHLRQLDDPTHPTPSRAAARPVLDATPRSEPCAGAASASGLPASTCRIWGASGYPDPAPQSVVFGPLRLPGAVAYRLRFAAFDVHTSDRLYVEDGQGAIVQALTGAGPAGGVTAWIYDDDLQLRWVTDGVARSNRGWEISAVEYLSRSSGPAEEHHPTIYVVDLGAWNGTAPRDFAAAAADGGALLRITRRCTGAAQGICIDEARAPILREMTCPISTEVAVYTVGNAGRALYWGDECGQLWKAWSLDQEGSDWGVRRILRLNDHPSLADQAVSRGRSKDFRKVFRRIDLVPTTCPGQRAVGLYFGSGNVQRPGSTDELADPGLNDGRDVVGAVWDTGDLPDGGLTLADLSDVSGVASIDARAEMGSGKRGWFWSLAQNERMLRDPLVFDSVAYFKTFRPSGSSSECVRSSGIDTVYAVNNCSAKAVVDGPGSPIEDRAVWSMDGEVGGSLLLLTPKDGSPIVTHANLGKSERADLVQQQRRRVPRIFLWREPRGN